MKITETINKIINWSTATPIGKAIAGVIFIYLPMILYLSYGTRAERFATHFQSEFPLILIGAFVCGISIYFLAKRRINSDDSAPPER